MTSLFSYDIFGHFDPPSITLCNPDKAQICGLGPIYNTNLSLKYNALWEFKFDIMETIQNEKGDNVLSTPYPLLKNKKLLLIDGIGYFKINKVVENKDGTTPIKNVECVSLEYELLDKQLNAFTGTLKFYDSDSPVGTFMEIILRDTTWTVGTVDVLLLDVYRTFDISSNTVYNTLMTEAETAFGCVFTFDTFNRTVNAIHVSNATYDTDIYLSKVNLVKNSKFSEISDEIATVLNVFGGDDLDIRGVNPLGTNKIYNFDYYKTLEWMDQNLINAINTWNTRVNNYQPGYADYVTFLKSQQQVLSGYEGELLTLKNELAALTEVKRVQVEGNQDLTAINTQIDAKNVEIENKNTQIYNIQHSGNSSIDAITSAMVAINNILALTNPINFTPTQLTKLKAFMIENVYQNNNIIITDSMDLATQQKQPQELYNQAKTVLAKTSVPRYEFELDVVNIFALQEYEYFTDQMNLGARVIIEDGEDLYITTGLLEIDISFDDPENFKLIFSNRLRLDNGSFVYSDFFGNVQNSTTKSNFNSAGWDTAQSQVAGPINTFITSALDASKNKLISSNAETIVINEHGLIAKQAGTQNQLWMTSSILAFSDDNFQTAKLALGNVPLANGGSKYGIFAEVIYGNIIAGDQLIISNANNSFRVDGSGATLTNAKLTVESASNIITVSPTGFSPNTPAGISIYNKLLGYHTFYADSNGDLHIVGTIFANNGSFSGRVVSSEGLIGGWDITSSGISKTINGVSTYFNSNGTMKIGPLTINSDGSAVFAGNVTAQKITGQVTNSQIGNGAIDDRTIGSINAGKINAGIINGINIYGSVLSYGGTLALPNVRMYGTGDIAFVQSVGTVQIYVNGLADLNTQSVSSTLYLSNKTAGLYVPYNDVGQPVGQGGTVTIGVGMNKIVMNGFMDLTNISHIYMPGPIEGKTITLNNIQASSGGPYTLTFKMGVLVNVT